MGVQFAVMLSGRSLEQLFVQIVQVAYEMQGVVEMARLFLSLFA